MSASLTVFEKEYESREKYIYFICGVAGASFAYIGKDYFPVHPLDWPAKLTIGSLFSLMVCFAFGMARIQVYIHGLSINRDVLVAEDELTRMNDSWIKHEQGAANMTLSNKTGKTFNVSDLEDEINTLRAKKDKDFKRMENWFKWATILFVICHVFLAFGFILLICAKLAG